MSITGSYRVVFTGLFEGKHRKRMRLAVWTFGALLDWQTTPDGWVWGGKPIQAATLGKRLGISARQASRDLELLAAEGYVEIERVGNGYRVRIVRQKKFGPEQECRSDRHATSIRSSRYDDLSALHTAHARSDSEPTSKPTQRQLSLFDPRKKNPERELGASSVDPAEERRRTFGRCQCGYRKRPCWVDGRDVVVAVENCPRCYRRGYEMKQKGATG